MLAFVQSVALVGVEGHPVGVEVGLTRGVPNFTIVGLPDAAVREARERVRAAIQAAGFDWPKRRITVNLAPAGLPKSGSWYDLPIAVGILCAAGRIPAAPIEGVVFLGELALSGATRGVPGVLPAALCARQTEAAGIAVPAVNCREASAVPGLAVHPIRALTDLAAGLPAPGGAETAPEQTCPVPSVDFGDVAGHSTAKFGLQVAAAGGHHCLLVGEPGSGKTMLARRLPTILPPLSETEQIEASLVHSIAGMTCGLLTERPFRAPHHSASTTSLIGGGTVQVAPGEVSLAHRGVLFLDELGEFRPHTLDALRQPLEDGVVQICRRSLRVALPARFMLVAATNPCPCGFAGSPRRVCACDAGALARYSRRLSGPLLDRIDVTVPVSAVPPGELLRHAHSPESRRLREAVVAARERQAARLGDGRCNASLSSREVHDHCSLAGDAERALLACAKSVSSRGVVKVQKLAMTVADLAGAGEVRAEHVELAWLLRCPSDADMAGDR